MSSESEEFRQDLLSLVDTFVTDTAEVKGMMVRLTDQIKSMEEDLGYMNKVVRDGNGRPPMITRMELLEQDSLKLKKPLTDGGRSGSPPFRVSSL